MHQNCNTLFFNLGQRTTPSTVAFTDDGQRLVGIPAKRQVSIRKIRIKVFAYVHGKNPLSIFLATIFF